MFTLLTINMCVVDSFVIIFSLPRKTCKEENYDIIDQEYNSGVVWVVYYAAWGKWPVQSYVEMRGRSSNR